MATIINNPGREGGNSGNGSGGLIIGIVVAIVVLIIVFMFVLPNMRGTAPATTNTPAPSANDGGADTVNVEVPDEIDVNMKK
jgi:hypothetical protein